MPFSRVAQLQIGPLEHLYDGRTFYHQLNLLLNSEATNAIDATDASQQAMLREAMGMGSDEDCEGEEGAAQGEEEEVDDFNAVLPVCMEPKKSEILQAVCDHRVAVVNGKTG